MFNKKLFWIIVTTVVLVASGGVYFFYNNVYLQAQEPVETAMTTAQVQRGDIIITADGSGTLVPASEVDLGFRSGGVVAGVLVAVGDHVEAGQLLARQEDADAQDQVAQAEINLRQAELKLDELTQEADPADLAAVQASLASAKAELTRLTSPPAERPHTTK
jgi:multidrug efflux pump subunit AcrA (membrane-fusion protein)